jgi:16S rRNA processing protein RimM
MDKTKGHIGAITDVIDNGPNIVIQVDCNGKEIMLPYNEDLVLGIDQETKVLNYNAPEGLIDMYLEQ